MLHQIHVDAAVMKTLRTSRIILASKCAKRIQTHIGSVWWDPFMMESYLVYNFCTKGLTPDVSETLLTSCMHTNLMSSFYVTTKSLDVEEHIVSLVLKHTVKTPNTFIHERLLDLCADILEDALDEDSVVSFLQERNPYHTVRLGTSFPKRFDTREKDGSVRHRLFRRFRIKSKINKDQEYFQIELPVVLFDKNGSFTKTLHVQMFQLTVCGPESHWTRFTLRPKTHGYHYATFADMVVHLTTPFLTKASDNQKAHAAVLFLIMGFLHERGGSLATLEKWRPWKSQSTADDPFLVWGASCLHRFRDLLRRESKKKSEEFVQKVTYLYNTFVVCFIMNRHLSYPAVTYITPQSIADD